jgi:hypothetical protein
MTQLLKVLLHLTTQHNVLSDEYLVQMVVQLTLLLPLLVTFCGVCWDRIFCYCLFLRLILFCLIFS